jgi:hypothetical protein
MINRMRELLPYAEVPIRLVIRARQTQTLQARLAATEEMPVLTPDVDERPRPAPVKRNTTKKPVRSKAQRTTIKQKKAVRQGKTFKKPRRG